MACHPLAQAPTPTLAAAPAGQQQPPPQENSLASLDEDSATPFSEVYTPAFLPFFRAPRPPQEHVIGFASRQGSCDIAQRILGPSKDPCHYQNIDSIPSLVVPSWTCP